MPRLSHGVLLLLGLAVAAAAAAPPTGATLQALVDAGWMSLGDAAFDPTNPFGAPPAAAAASHHGRDVGSAWLKKARGSPTQPRGDDDGPYDHSFDDGPACPGFLPKTDIQASDIADALADLDTLAQAALKPKSSVPPPPGIHVNVVYNGKTLFSKGYGTTYTNFNASAPGVDGPSVFRIGSNSKLFTTLALFALAEQGIVHVHDPLIKYIPEFRVMDPFSNGGNFTLLELASFQAGLQREGCVLINGKYGCGLFLGANQTAILDALRFSSTLFPRQSLTPLYSNLQIALLGHALDAAIKAADNHMTGFDDYLYSYMFPALGFTATRYNVTEAIKGQMAWSPKSAVNDYVRFMDVGWLNPAGGLFMSGDDMAKWLGFLTSARNTSFRNPVLSQAALRAFQRPVTMFPSGTSGFGYSSFCLYDQGSWLFTKGGAVPGYGSGVAILQDIQLGISVMASSDFDASSVTAPALTKLVPAVRAAIGAKAKASALHKYGGVYKSTIYPLNFTVGVSDTSLTLVVSNQPTNTQLLLPGQQTASFTEFQVIQSSTESCYLGLALIAADTGGKEGSPIYGSAMVRFEMGADGTADTATNMFHGLVFTKVSSP